MSDNDPPTAAAASAASAYATSTSVCSSVAASPCPPRTTGIDNVHTWAGLGNDMWSIIGSFLPQKDLSDLALVCIRFGRKKYDADGEFTARSLMEDVAFKLAMDIMYGDYFPNKHKDHIDFVRSAPLSDFCLYYLLHYNISMNCTDSRCCCRTYACGKTRRELREEFEGTCLFLGRTCTPECCECVTSYCGLKVDNLDDPGYGAMDIDDEYMTTQMRALLDEEESHEDPHDYSDSQDYWDACTTCHGHGCSRC
mmetsp:Transcript_9596/g.21645  ORF Transcript_9596/g.21645 Transcript_9596/m.21645 type:complete len:253 (-) Transcript_9596:286-1044(-)